jgi:hypothetical protein
VDISKNWGHHNKRSIKLSKVLLVCEKCNGLYIDSFREDWKDCRCERPNLVTQKEHFKKLLTESNEFRGKNSDQNRREELNYIYSMIDWKFPNKKR